jgi:uncharacterized protein
VLSVYVQPNATRTECAGRHGDALKIRVASPPVDGAANAALCLFLSEVCGVSRSAIVVQSGHHGRRKRVLVKGITSRRLAQLLPLAP